jgi:hypothetical protein
VACGVYFYVARPDIVRDEIIVLSSASTVVAAAMYFVMTSASCWRESFWEGIICALYIFLGRQLLSFV